MASFNGAPMDEIQWRLEEAVAHFGGIRAENIHLYFLVSPFCDSTSNNKSKETQLRYDPSKFHVLQDRSAFEAEVRQMSSGIEYMISAGPKHTTPDMNPIWTIRKQRRTKTVRSQDSRAANAVDTIELLGTYYAIGENIYQAPSIMDILSNRLLTIEDNMQNILKTATSMQYFSPTLGHRYMLDKFVPTEKDVQDAPASNGAPHADPSIDTPKSLQVSLNKESDDSHALEQNLILRSLNLSTRYGTEFIDTNPLLGEPGSLKFSSTEEHLQTQAAAKAKAVADKLAKEARSATASSLPSPSTDPKTSFGRKGSKAEKSAAGSSKLKRRKSRITGSPDED